MSKSDLSDGKIRHRVSVFEAEPFPPDDGIYFAEYLAKYQQGAVAEKAVQRCATANASGGMMPPKRFRTEPTVRRRTKLTWSHPSLTQVHRQGE